MMADLFKKKIKSALTYNKYKALVEKLVKSRKTTGANQSHKYIHYTEINLHRMSRLEKTTAITPALQEIVTTLKKKYTWLILTEAWCGDAAQNIPVINKIAELSPNINLLLILRDENLDLMDRYLTNGGRSIPKLIAIDSETLEELGTWGPRPKGAQDMYMEHKNNPVMAYEDFQKDVQMWYLKDKALSLQNEFAELLKKWEG